MAKTKVKKVNSGGLFGWFGSRTPRAKHVNIYDRENLMTQYKKK